jgi:hypothetical protein
MKQQNRRINKIRIDLFRLVLKNVESMLLIHHRNLVGDRYRKRRLGLVEPRNDRLNVPIP